MFIFRSMLSSIMQIIKEKKTNMDNINQKSFL